VFQLYAMKTDYGECLWKVFASIIIRGRCEQNMLCEESDTYMRKYAEVFVSIFENNISKSLYSYMIEFLLK